MPHKTKLRRERHLKFGKIFRKLKDDGSFVLDLGGAYEPGSPTRSLYNFRVPIHFCDELGFHLAEDFYWFNSRCPVEAEAAFAQTCFLQIADCFQGLKACKCCFARNPDRTYRAPHSAFRIPNSAIEAVSSAKRSAADS